MCQHLAQHPPWGPGFTRAGSTEGHQIFADALMRFAEQNHCLRFAPIIARVGASLRVAVQGRDGVGRGTVAAALTASGPRK
jgi:hypothetical protein